MHGVMFFKKCLKLFGTLLIVKIGVEVYTILQTDNVTRRRRDAESDGFDVTKWFRVNLTQVDAGFGSKFTQLEFDTETKIFLEDSKELTNSFTWLLYCTLGTDLLKLFLTKTNINGLLNRGSMFVLSKYQIKTLLGINDQWSDSPSSILDLGAGDGFVTSQFAPFFDQIHVTETAFVMRWRLARLPKVQVLPDISSWADTTDPSPNYNVISALNLVDRCQQPLQLLKQIRDKLLARDNRGEAPGSASSENQSRRPLLLLAVVFPFSQYVEFPDVNQQTEKIELKSSSLTTQAHEFYNEWLAPIGFKLVKWTRVPYLCQGDRRRSFYALHDVVYVLEPFEIGV